MINKIGNKIANKTTKVSWNLPHNNSEVVESDTEISKKDTQLRKKGKKITDDIRLIWYNNGISKSNELVIQYTESTI